MIPRIKRSRESRIGGGIDEAAANYRAARRWSTPKNAGNFAEIEGRLVPWGACALGLASASVFREEGGVFQRSAEDQGWDDAAARTLDPRDPMLEPVQTRRPFGVGAKAAARNHLPDGLMRPILAVPVGDRFAAWPLRSMDHTQPAMTSRRMSAPCWQSSLIRRLAYL